MCRVERLTGLDAGFVYMETPTLHMHTLKIGVLDPSTVPGGYTFERFREELGNRLHLLPPFRRRLVPVPLGLHHPVWIDDPDFDIDSHIRSQVLPEPGGRREIDEAIADIAGRQLPRDRPLWEITVLEGAADDQIVFVGKIHHSLADGVAAAELLANVMSTDPDELDAPEPDDEWAGEPVPTRRRLVLDALRERLRQLLSLPRLLGRTVGSLRAVVRRRRETEVSPPVPIRDTPVTSFNSALSGRRSFATTTLSLGEMKAVKSALGVTLNDVLLALVAGSLRRYLEGRDELPDGPLVAGVPVSTDQPEGIRRLGGNRVSNMFTIVPTHLEDPVERVKAVHEVTAAAKEVHNLLGADMLADWSEFTPGKPYAWFMRRYSHHELADRHSPPINLVVSNVPGPREPLFIGGGRLAGLYSVGPILEGIGLNVTAWSYLDEVNVGVLGSRPQLEDPWAVTAGLHVSLDELRDASRERAAG